MVAANNVRLAFCKVRAAEMATFRPPTSTGLENVTVLVVDDSRVMRDLMKTILHGIGVRTIFEASNGAEGLEVFRDCKPDIIFADWMMEPIDGAEFVQFIRKSSDSPNRHVPIIMLTGHTEAPRIRKARDLGATEFLAKPVSTRAVAERIEAVIHRPRPFVRTSTFYGPDRRRKVASFEGLDRRGNGSEKPLIEIEAGRDLARKTHVD